MSKLTVNPYYGVDWGTVLKCRANFHTHTTESDGGLYGSDVIEKYKTIGGYKILFLTDHDSYRKVEATPSIFDHVLDLCSYPWSIWEGTEILDYSTTWYYSPGGTVTQPPVGTFNLADGVVTFPDGYKMLTGKATEYTRGHHVNMFFGGDCGFSEDEDGAIANIQSAGGMGMICHPSYPTLPDLSWFETLYSKYPIDVLPGIEVINGTDPAYHTVDRALWDNLLVSQMPNRPVWGYSNDDMHGLQHMFKAYQYYLLPELTEQALKTGMTQGASFICFDATGNDATRLDYGSARAPMINVISVTNTAISIVAENYESINWIYDGAIVGTGNTFDFSGYTKNYVRAELLGIDGVYTYTQPFGFENAGIPVEVNDKFVKVNNVWELIDKAFCKQDGIWLESGVFKK